MDLGRNNFTGPLPSDWWTGGDSLVRLRHLFLDHNQFTGVLPDEFPEIGGGRLNQLTMAFNDFEGVFPGSWDPINKLVALEIQGNRFTRFDNNFCRMVVFNWGELVSLRSDCSMCSCGEPLCARSVCLAD